jgi:hypothetical protein
MTRRNRGSSGEAGSGDLSMRGSAWTCYTWVQVLVVRSRDVVPSRQLAPIPKGVKVKLTNEQYQAIVKTQVRNVSIVLRQLPFEFSVGVFL